MARRPNERGRKSKPVRRALNPARQLWLALAAVAALGLGYLVAAALDLIEKPAPVQSGVAQSLARTEVREPWYKTQSPPPELVSGPNAPILPEANGTPATERPRAYEEALPEEVYHAPPPPPMPVSKPQEPVTPATTPADPPIHPAPRPAWEQFALAAPETAGRPMIAIVIDDMGMDRKRTAKAIGLPGPLTLSFLAYADELAQQTRNIRAAGHELMLHVSMEPASKSVDPGPNVLLATDAPEEIRRRLIWGLDRLSGVVGINNHMGSRFTEDRAGMSVVMNELKERGLLFLDSRTTPRSVGAVTGRAAGVPVVERNVFLDNVNEVKAVNLRLAEAERVARRAGAAIAIGHPRDATLAALAEWIESLGTKGLVLVPLSAIVRSTNNNRG
ncbi:MAG: divergent polysaccharide deacetylase family protein [Rhodospirillales bacterium]|nr:divergent polysaccharide deacetylase family protein [Rhodospirillales bacterium]